MAATPLPLAASRLLLAHWAWAVLCLLLKAVPTSAQNIGVGPVDFAGVVNPSEITDKWWFWLIIGIIGAFFIVAGYFVWRGFSQWKKQHKIEVAEDEERQKAAAAGKPGRPRVAVMPVSAGGAGRPGGDIELGVVGVQPPAPGEPLNEEQAAWLRERERRTASHQKRKW